MSLKPTRYDAIRDLESYAGFSSDQLYTTAELATISGQTVAFWESRRKKELPPSYMKLGRSVKYLGKDIIAFLKAGRQEGRGLKEAEE